MYIAVSLLFVALVSCHLHIQRCKMNRQKIRQLTQVVPSSVAPNAPHNAPDNAVEAPAWNYPEVP